MAIGQELPTCQGVINKYIGMAQILKETAGARQAMAIAKKLPRCTKILNKYIGMAYILLQKRRRKKGYGLWKKAPIKKKEQEKTQATIQKNT